VKPWSEGQAEPAPYTVSLSLSFLLSPFYMELEQIVDYVMRPYHIICKPQNFQNSAKFLENFAVYVKGLKMYTL
jgi:hypothetical protein